MEKTPVVVYAATRLPVAAEATAASVTVVFHQQIQDHQYDSFVDALEQIPGIAVVRTGTQGQVTSLFTRGTQSNHTLITIDGRRQAAGLSGADDELTNLTLDDVDRIEDVRTGDSTVSGGNAIGGVVNIVTQSGQGLTKPTGSVYFEGGSYDTFREGAELRGSESGFDYSLGASRMDSAFDRPNNDYRNTAYRGKYGYQIGKDLYFDLLTSYQETCAASPNSIFTPDPTARLVIEDWNLSPGITWKTTQFYTTRCYFTHDQQRQVYQDYGMPTVFTIDTRQQINTDLFDWQNNLQLARNWQLSAGIQGDNQSVVLRDNVANDDPVTNTLFTIGGYLESQYQPIEGLNILNSVRYDAYSDYPGAVSWRQGVSYRIDPTRTVVHTTGFSAYSPPSIQDLYYPGAANPNLKPEKDLGWEFGVEQPFLQDRVTLGATYFHNHISNFIQPDGNFIPQNIPHAMTEGVEIVMTAHPLDQLTLTSNYSYLTAEDTTDHLRLIRRPRSLFNADAVWKPISELTFTLGGTWVIGRQDQTFDPVTFAPENIELPNYATLRMTGTWRVTPNLELWARGENILNEKYQPVLGYPALGATAYAGIRYKY